MRALLVALSIAGCAVDAAPMDGGDGAVRDAASPIDAVTDGTDPDLATPASADLAVAPCGAIGQACCPADLCDGGAVCVGATCVAAIGPATCPQGAAPALFVGETAPPSMMAPWDSAWVTVTFANCGAAPWQASAVDAPNGFKLGAQAPQDGDTWTGGPRVALPADVPAGSQVTIAARIRAPALTGVYGYAWGIVHEGVAWLPLPSPTHMVTVEASARMAAICPGVTADIGGVAPAAAALQACIDAAPDGGEVALPAGIYRIDAALTIAKRLTLRTVGTAGLAGCLDFGGPPCAVFRAAADLDVPRGFLRPSGTAVAIDHVVLDGNRARRTASAAAQQCAGGNNGPGFNASTPDCAGCSFVGSGSARALCGTGFEWVGAQATITGSTFRDNGDHATKNMWSDGLTLLHSDGANVVGNQFIDNSDVDLIVGGATAAMVAQNLIVQRRQASFAGLMLDNFNGVTPGDFTSAKIVGNRIDCGALSCDFGIELGPHPWYLSANIFGGAVTGNTVAGAKIGINAEGAGTLAAPTVVAQNTVGPSPISAAFLCGMRPTTSFNVSPDAHVDLAGGPAPTASMIFHTCP